MLPGQYITDSKEIYENILTFLNLPADLHLMVTQRSKTVMKTPMVSVLRVSLGFILPFPVDYSYLEVDY